MSPPNDPSRYIGGTLPLTPSGIATDPVGEGLAKADKFNPLRPYSLLGRADELEAKAADTQPLLGDFIMSGQATMIYAAPNTGKTLIVLHLLLEAIEQGRIDPDRVFYVNADDTSRGVATKARLLQDVGAHMVVPGL